MFAKEDPYIGKAYECLTKLSADEEKRLEYEAREKAIRDYNWQMKSNWEAGRRDGLKQGIEQGIEQVLRKTVLNMIAKGMSDEEICEITECTPEYAAKLRKEHH